MSDLSEEQERKLQEFQEELEKLREIVFNPDDSAQTKMIYLLHQVAKQLVYLNAKVDRIEESVDRILFKDLD